MAGTFGALHGVVTAEPTLADVAPTLARFIAGTAYPALPPATIARAKISILDACGAMLGGSREPASQLVQRYLSTSRADPGATVLGTNLRTFPALAAFANGVAAHSLCYDDTHLVTMTHTSAVVLPAALATAEVTAASGADLLTAYTVGFEVTATVGRILGIGHYKKGWHATSTVGVFGAAAAAAHLLRLDETQAATALALAASSAAGLRSNLGYMSMFYHAGNAARLGVDAAHLGRLGFSASPFALEADMGFYDMYAAAAEEVTPAELLTLGAPFDLEQPGTSIKPFACGALSHRAIQAAVNLHQHYTIESEAIERVECAVSYAHPRVLIHPRPKDILEGKISMQFPVAVALTLGRCGAQDLTEAMLQRADIRALIEKIEMVVPPELSAAVLGGREPYDTPATVTVYFKDGSTLSETVECERGHPTLPVSYTEMWDKFYDSVAALRSEAEARELHALIERIEQVTDLGPFYAGLGASEARVPPAHGISEA